MMPVMQRSVSTIGKEIFKMAAGTTFFNATHTIHPGMLVYPGDPPCLIEVVSSLETGVDCRLCHIHMSNHAGTHIDYPAHFIAEAKTSDHFPLQYLMGSCIVVEIPEGPKFITLDHLPLDIKKGDMVFFKTANSKLTKYSPEYVTLSIESAQALKDRQVKIVGIDYLSVDTADSTEFPIHHILLGADILIVENLKLKEIPPGRYQARIYPLQIAGIDGAPVTTSLETL